MRTALALVLSLASCSALDKDNEPVEPTNLSASVETKLEIYTPLVRSELDDHDLVVMGDSIGDSALFSCLARVGGAASFDPSILFKDGKPIRHPDIAPGISKTPISKDMVNGVLWCLWDLARKDEKSKAIALTESMIAFGKAHRQTIGAEIGWMFCTDDDRTEYAISDEDWVGKCFMAPAIVKDIYRLAKWLGLECDSDCSYYMALGPNIPSDATGFKRHLAVLTTVRNGLIEGAINDNSLNFVLKNSAKEQPRNALYLAAYALFTDGDQTASYDALLDESLFPAEGLPTKNQYCTHYLYQREHPSDDWEPCPTDEQPDRGRGVEWIFAASLALGDLQ